MSLRQPKEPFVGDQKMVLFGAAVCVQVKKKKNVIFCSKVFCRGCFRGGKADREYVERWSDGLVWVARVCPGFGPESLILGNFAALDKLG